MGQEKLPLAIDTDMCLDDALAVMYSVESKKFDLKALSVVSGNQSIDNTIEKLCYVMRRLPREPSFTISLGSPTSMRHDGIPERGYIYEEDVDLLSCFNSLPIVRDFDKTMIPKCPSAAQKLVDLSNEYSGKLCILALGPLTNIKEALDLDPDLMKKVHKIFIMGGNVPGSDTSEVELNFRLDPESARTVINACKSTDTRDKSSIIPWEACETCIFSHNIDGQGKIGSLGMNTIKEYPMCDLYACLIAEDDLLVKKWHYTEVDVIVSGYNDSESKPSGSLVAFEEKPGYEQRCVMRIALELDTQRILKSMQSFILNNFSRKEVEL